MAGHQLVAHAVGVLAADVIALQQNLVAAAHAHQLMAQLVEARVGVGAKEEHGERGEQRELRNAAEQFRVSSFEFHKISFEFRVTDYQFDLSSRVARGMCSCSPRRGNLHLMLAPERARTVGDSIPGDSSPMRFRAAARFFGFAFRIASGLVRSRLPCASDSKSFDLQLKRHYPLPTDDSRLRRLALLLRRSAQLLRLGVRQQRDDGSDQHTSARQSRSTSPADSRAP